MHVNLKVTYVSNFGVAVGNNELQASVCNGQYPRPAEQVLSRKASSSFLLWRRRIEEATKERTKSSTLLILRIRICEVNGESLEIKHP